MKTVQTLLLVFGMGAGLTGCSDPNEETANVDRPQLYISESWMRQPIAGRDMSAAYVSVVNSGRADDVLVSVQAPLAARVEIHQTRTQNGIASMEKMDTSPIPMGDGLRMEPSGTHLMLFGLKKNFKDGDELYLSLIFETSEPITIKIPVRETAPQKD